MTLAAVIFDWGGTLTPWHTIDLAEKWLSYAQLVAPDDPATLATALHTAELEAWNAIRIDQRSATFAGILAAAGATHHDDAVAAYRASWERHTFTDAAVPDLFGALRERGLKIGVLSNTIWPRAWHEEFFSRDGVLGLVDGAVYSSEIDYTKPHEQAFRAAMSAVGVEDPAQCVFVGDRPYDDIFGARAVGMRAVLVPHSELPAQDLVAVQPDAVVEELSELVEHIDAWHPTS